MIARNFVKQFNLLQNLRVSHHVIKRHEVQNTQVGAPTYDGDGKTSATILNKELENGIMINGISKLGFRLNNDLLVVGPVILFPRTLFSWNVERVEDINEKSLCMFALLDPKLEILVLGTGDTNVTPDFQRRIFGYMKKYNINVEVLPTEAACATYNFLCSEGRACAAAMIPPGTISVSEDDYVKYMIDRQHILELE